MDRRCRNCIKAANSSSGVKCRVLTELVGESADCWAFSADPDFWKRYRKAVDAYRQAYFARHGGLSA